MSQTRRVSTSGFIGKKPEVDENGRNYAQKKGNSRLSKEHRTYIIDATLIFQNKLLLRKLFANTFHHPNFIEEHILYDNFCYFGLRFSQKTKLLLYLFISSHMKRFCFDEKRHIKKKILFSDFEKCDTINIIEA